MKIPSRTGVTAGVTTGSPPDERSRGRRRAVVAALVASGLVGTSLILPGIAAAVPPAFPDNIVVFPDPDFVTIEGFQDRVGQIGTVEVRRGTEVIGSAKGTVEAGDVAFEVNHPGGLCWGAGTGLNVTPDIRAGDVVSLAFDSGGTAGDTTVSSATVTADAALDGNKLTVKGHVGADVDRNQMEQRIIQPDLKDTVIGRRDVRAIPGPEVPAPKGGYTSGIAFTDTTVPGEADFSATYTFDTPELAATAAAADLGERAMNWQVQDDDGNRQGLTIAEFGEAGGPGMGGCPAGPANQNPAAGSAGFVLAGDKKSMQVSWTPATPIPTGAAVTGYDVTVLAPTAAGESKYLGTRTAPTATRTTIAGLDPLLTYTVEVRALAGAKLGDPFPIGSTTPGGGTPGDTTAPTLTAAPAGGANVGAAVQTASVTLTANEPADIYFTTDGTPALNDGDLPSDAAKLYTAPIPITGPTQVRWAAFDAAGNHDTGLGFYAAAAPPTTIAVPTALSGTGGQGTATLRWASTAANVTGYDVQLYLGAGAAGLPSGGLRPATDKTLTVSGLTTGTYSFTVIAKTAAGNSAASARSADFTVAPAGDRITVSSAKWKANDFRVVGTTSATGGSVSVLLTATGAPVAGMTGAVTPAAAPATGGTFDVRIRAGIPNPRPAQIWIRSSNGTVAGPFATTAG
jgi:hypothetical protein